MKLFLTCFLASIFAAKGAISNLRAKQPAVEEDKEKLTDNIGFVGATVTLTHVSSAGEWPVDILENALVTAYNSVHKGSAYEIMSSYLDDEIAVPENDGNNDEERGVVSRPRTGFYESISWSDITYKCKGKDCGAGASKGRRRRLPPLALHATTNPGLHQQFVDKLFSTLTGSGSQAFATLKSCEVVFTYPPNVGDDESTAVGWGKRNHDFHATIGSEIFMTHLTSTDSSSMETDITALSKAVMGAYNEVHADTPYYMESFSLERIIEIPEDDDDDSDDEDDNDEGDNDGPDVPLAKRRKRPRYRRRNVATQNLRCVDCPPDRMGMLGQVAQKQLSDMQTLMDERLTAFEDLVKYKLKHSGLDEYKSMRECKIRFSYSDEDPGGPFVAEQQRN